MDSHIVSHLRLVDAPEDRRTSASAEGARPTLISLPLTEGSVHLQKHQAELRATYEGLSRSRLQVLQLFLRRLGAQLASDETEQLLELALAGDGTPGSASGAVPAAEPGSLEYADLVRLRLAFPSGYDMDTVVVSNDRLQAVLTLPEFNDPQAGFLYQATGKVPEFFGARWHRWSSAGSPAFTGTGVLAVDSANALAQYTEAPLLVEAAGLIDTQVHQVVVSKWTGFGKLDYNAVRHLDFNTD